MRDTHPVRQLLIAKLHIAIGSLGLAIALCAGEASTALISYWAAEGNANDSVGPNSGTLVGGTLPRLGSPVRAPSSLFGSTAERLVVT